MKVLVTAILSILATSFWWAGAFLLAELFIPAGFLTFIIIIILSNVIYEKWEN